MDRDQAFPGGSATADRSKQMIRLSVRLELDSDHLLWLHANATCELTPDSDCYYEEMSPGAWTTVGITRFRLYRVPKFEQMLLL